MLSRKLTSLLAMALVALAATVNAHDTNTKPANSEKLPYTFHGEADKTDALAIPSDSTEEELDEEIDELNEEAKSAHRVSK